MWKDEAQRRGGVFEMPAAKNDGGVHIHLQLDLHIPAAHL